MCGRPEQPSTAAGIPPRRFFYWLSEMDTQKPVDYVRTRKEAAALLRVSLRTLTRMEQSGKAPKRTKITDRIYGYRDSSITEFLNSRTAA
jgi:predicted DNA-binding transcriptional regulator AlpA